MPYRTSQSRLTLALATVALGLLVAGPAHALTIATFSDPTVGTPLQYMFEVRDGAPGAVSQPANAPTVDLSIDASLPGGGVYNDVTMVLPQLTYTGGFLAGATLDAGYVDFVKDNQSLLRIDFDGGYVSRSTLGGDDIFSGNNVSFAVMGQPLEIEQGTGSFAFSFTNQNPFPGGGEPTTGFDATAAFTSSANVVPEPATLVFLGLGLGTWLHRRR